jgi:hypothetical protein
MMKSKFVVLVTLFASSMVCTQAVMMSLDKDEQKNAENSWCLNDIKLLNSYDFFDGALVLTTERWEYFPKCCSGSVCFSFSSTQAKHFLLKRVTTLTIDLYKTDDAVFVEAKFVIPKTERSVPFQFLIPDNELHSNPRHNLILVCLNQLLGMLISCEQGTFLLDERCDRCGKPISHPNYGEQEDSQDDDESLIVVKEHYRTKCGHTLCKRCFGTIYTACPRCSTALGVHNDVIRVLRHSHPLILLQIVDSLKPCRYKKKGAYSCKK